MEKTKLETMMALKTYMFEQFGFEVTPNTDTTIKVERMNDDGTCLIINVPSRMIQLTKVGYVLNLNDRYGTYLKSWQVNHTDEGYEILLVLDLFQPIITNSGISTRFSRWHDCTDWMNWMDIAYLQSVKDAKWDVML